MYFSIYSNAPFQTKQELFNTQHDTLESYERQFASLRQCCSGTASDLSSFEAKTLAILKRMEERGRSLAADVWSGSEPGDGELKSGKGRRSKLSFSFLFSVYQKQTSNEQQTPRRWTAKHVSTTIDKLEG